MFEIKDLIGSGIYSDGLMTQVKISPNKNLVSYLKARSDGSGIQDLWAYDREKCEHVLLLDASSLKSDKTELSDAEKAIRERTRTFTSGIFEYHWTNSGEGILIPSGSKVFLFAVADNQVSELFEAPSGVMYLTESQDGKFLYYVSGHNVFEYDVEGRKIQDLTGLSEEGCIFAGSAEFVVQEELSRYSGFWLSPDGNWLVFEEFDESGVEKVIRNEIYADHVATTEQRYPFAGKANVTYKLGVIDLKGERDNIRYIDAPSEDTYLARGCFHPDSNDFYFQVLTRDQKELSLHKWVVTTSDTTCVLTERQKPWVNVGDVFRFVNRGKSFLWGSERSGFSHVYEIDVEDGSQIALTMGQFPVRRVVCYTKESLYVEAYSEDGMNIELLRFDKKDKSVKKLFCHSGHVSTAASILDNKNVTEREIESDSHGHVHIDGEENVLLALVHNSSLSPQKVYIAIDCPGQKNDAAPKIIHEVGVKLPNDQTLEKIVGERRLERISNGETEFNLSYQLPVNFDPSKKYPAVLYVYGGPHAQVVTHAWTGDRGMFLSYLANQGFVVFSIDGRGSFGRGLQFESAIYKTMGQTELLDQLIGVDYVKKLPFVDPARIGVHGWSYGGFMTIICMLRAPQVFKVGVSGAPVTDFADYDTCYTERYMQTPDENPEGYEKTALWREADKLEGKLLLIHGMADDNVLFTNSTKMYSALQKAEKHFDIMVYPGEKHSVAGKVAKVHNYASIARYFVDHL